jgi:DNA sulfur modification protein DndD
MNLLKLTLNNFRIFYGERVIEFSNDSNKNVTLVHAENGMGKTTMLNAIKWCLYSRAPDFEDEGKDSRMLNYISNEEGNHTLSVEIEFLDEDKKYIVKREAIEKDSNLAFGIDRGLTVMEQNKGALIPKKSNPQAFINNILPEELSDYFLFAGETYKAKKTAQASRTLYKAAVRNILGFTLSDAAVKDLDELEKGSQKELNSLHKKNTSTKKLSDEIDDLAIKIAELEREKHLLDEDIKAQEVIIENCSEDILKSNHYEAEDLESQRKTQVTYRKNEEENLRNYTTERQSLINDYGYAIFGYSLKKKMDFINEKEYEGKIPGEYYEGFVDNLLNTNKCICDRTLAKGSSEYQAVELLKGDAATTKIEGRVRKSFSALALFDGRSKEFLKHLERIDDAIDKSSELLTSFKLEIQRLASKLDALEHKPIQDLLEKKKRAELKKSTSERLSSKAEFAIENKKNEKLSKESSRDSLGTDTTKIKYKKEFISIVRKTGLRILDQQGKAEIKARELITKIVQQNIDDCLRKDFEVNLDHNYNLNLKFKDTEQGAAGVGQGQTLLTNLSFITALITHSKNRLKAQNRLFLPGTIAPFVIDAPFAEMDENYQKNTLEFLPNQSHQLILFLSSGQWKSDYEKVIGSKIGKRYYLLNHVPKNKKADSQKLIINKKEIKLNINDSKSNNFPMTTIEQIN